MPLWFLALGILTLVLRNRQLRSRPGNVPVRLRRGGKYGWSRGHGVWVHDVFAFRGRPAAWKEELIWVVAASPRAPREDEPRKLRRLGERPVVATLTGRDGGSFDVACRAEHGADLLRPFSDSAGPG